MDEKIRWKTRYSSAYSCAETFLNIVKIPRNFMGSTFKIRGRGLIGLSKLIETIKASDLQESTTLTSLLDSLTLDEIKSARNVIGYASSRVSISALKRCNHEPEYPRSQYQRCKFCGASRHYEVDDGDMLGFGGPAWGPWHF